MSKLISNVVVEQARDYILRLKFEKLSNRLDVLDTMYKDFMFDLSVDTHILNIRSGL